MRFATAIVFIFVFLFISISSAVDYSLQANVYVVLKGDVNRDCVVNVIDLAMVGKAFGSNPQSANWNPSADVYKDNVINIFDLATVGKNFGRIC